jgi:hypothetical protein
MIEKPVRPTLVWIAVLVNCLVGLSILAFDGVVVYAIAVADDFSPSVKDLAIIAALFLIPIICFVSAALALLRRKVARFLPIISVLILIFLIIDMILDIESVDLERRGLVTIGLAIFLLTGLFFTALPSILLFFGSAVEEYFGVSRTTKTTHLHEPPPPPPIFS